MASVQGMQAVEDGEASPEEILREAENAFGEIFSVRAPRDALAGLWSAAKCIMSGVMLGFAGLILSPVEGARSGGAAGCFKGVAAGLFTGVFLSLTGFCVGMFQAVRGVVATPKAICMAGRGWQWDGQEWAEPLPYSLPDEAQRVLGDKGPDDDDEDDDDNPPANASGSSSSKRRVADTYYYDQLCVAPSASQGEIRRAYFMQSRKWHPDKTSEPEAKERFQRISEAYQVLSDSRRRSDYDARGRQGAEEGFIDGRVFLSVLLGADALRPWVGKLRLAELFGGLQGAGAEGQSSGALAQQLRQLDGTNDKQARRQIRLAVALAEKLEPFVQGDALGPIRRAREEARAVLRTDAMLESFLAEIGWVYRNRGECYLASTGSALGCFGARAVCLRLQGTGREARQQANTAKLAVSSFMQLRKIVSEADEADRNAEGRQGAQAEELPGSLNGALPTFMETFWSLSAHDIRGTLDRVVERVLGDTSVSREDRERRAEGLRELGAALEEEALAAREAAMAAADGSQAQSDEQKRRRFEEAFMASMGSNTPSGD